MMRLSVYIQRIKELTSLRAAITGGLLLATVPVLQACSFSDLVKVDPISIDSEVSTKELGTLTAAVMRYNYAVSTMASAASIYSLGSGYWTDELVNLLGNAALGGLDARLESVFDNRNTGYSRLQTARNSAALAIEDLRKYSETRMPAMIAEMYALQGYAIVMLGEGFCSGIPLSTVTLDGDIRLGSGTTTEQMFHIATALFDSASVYADDNPALLTLIHVGAARAHLNLGHFTEAKSNVESVGVNTAYNLYYVPGDPGLAHWSITPSPLISYEGEVGLDWIATHSDSQDVRIPIAGPFQMKFDGNVSTVPLADGIEAGLIVAEAQLRESAGMNTAWLQTLNTLRATKVSGTGERLLPDLQEPNSYDKKVDLVFRERAFWMYLTGHRQGDLRRLIRQYDRSPNNLYPWGEYPVPAIASRYSENVVIGVPSIEHIGNQRFEGCYDTNP